MTFFWVKSKYFNPFFCQIGSSLFCTCSKVNWLILCEICGYKKKGKTTNFSPLLVIVGSGIGNKGRKEKQDPGCLSRIRNTLLPYLSELASMAGGRAHTRQEGIFSSVIFISLSPPPPPVSTPTDSGSTTRSFSSSSSPARLPRWKAAREGWLHSGRHSLTICSARRI